VVVDRTAAWLHGVETFAYGELETAPPIETCALRGHQPTARALARGRTRDLAAEDIIDVNGLAVTSPARTTLDVGCHLRRREAFAAMCLLTDLHGLDPVSLADTARRFRGRRGVVQLRDLLSKLVPGLESPREGWTYLAILDAGLPTPTAQLWVEVGGVPAYRLDFGYEKRRIAIEYDGREGHSSEEQIRHDAERREWLAANGWIVIVVRVGDFSGRGLDRWLGELRCALAPTYSTRRW
jgi:hypothetical protein